MTTETDQEFKAPEIEELMELIRYPRWEIKEHPRMGMHGLRIPETAIFLAVPGGREMLELLRAAHEKEVESYRKRLFAILAMFDAGSELGLIECPTSSPEERAEFDAWCQNLFGGLGRVARRLCLDGERLIDERIEKESQGN